MRKILLSGLLTIVPLAITAWVFKTIIVTMDQTLLILPQNWQPKVLLGFDIPGLGLILSVAIIFIIGLLANNLVGKYIVRLWDRLIHKIPVVNSIYSSVKQVSDTIFSPSGNAFRKAVLVQYPHANSWTIGFLTGTPGGDISNYLVGSFVSVYIPSTPNPTSGFFLMMATNDVHELDMPVDVALKYIVSMGVVSPASPEIIRARKIVELNGEEFVGRRVSDRV